MNKLKKLQYTLFPSVFILISMVAIYLNIKSKFYIEGIEVLLLLLILPLTFFIQGITCAKSKSNFILSLGLSLITCMILRYIIFDDSNLSVYNTMYFIVSLIGYLLTKLTIKIYSLISHKKINTQ